MLRGCFRFNPLRTGPMPAMSRRLLPSASDARHRRRTWGVAAVLLALLVQVWLPNLHMPVATVAGGGWWLGDAASLCMSRNSVAPPSATIRQNAALQGLASQGSTAQATIPPGNTPQGGAVPQDTAHEHACVICQSMPGGSAVPALALAAPAPVWGGDRLVQMAENRDHHPVRIFGDSAPRAPPHYG